MEMYPVHNFKMPTVVGILIYNRRIKNTSECFNAITIFTILVFMSNYFRLSLVRHETCLIHVT